MKAKSQLKLRQIVLRGALGFCAAALMLVTAAGCGGGGGGAGVPNRGLWVPNTDNNTVTEFIHSNRKTGTRSANLTNQSADLVEPLSSAFDKKNNLWVGNFGTPNPGLGVVGSIAEYTLSQLKALDSTPAPTANLVINLSFAARGLTFDRSGNLWVCGSTALVEFTASDLATATPAPSLTFTVSGAAHLRDVKFDKSGNLWLADQGTTPAVSPLGAVYELTPSQLSTSGTVTPSLILATTTLNGPYALVFDSKKNLWVANAGPRGGSGPFTLQKFAASDLSGTGSITPAAAVTISATSVTTSTGTANSLDYPRGLAFSPTSGNLWVANGDSDTHGSLAAFSPSQLKSSGSPAPKIFIDSDTTGTNLNYPGKISFGPNLK